MAIAGQPLHITVHKTGKAVVLRLKGEVSIVDHAAPEGELVTPIRPIRDGEVVFDMTEVKLVDSAGVDTAARIATRAEGHEVTVLPRDPRAIDTRVAELLELSSLLGASPFLPPAGDSPSARPSRGGPELRRGDHTHRKPRGN